jgi:hypothetical protein
MILDAIPSFRDKWKLRQKHFEFLTNQSPRLAFARTRHEREFSGAIQVFAQKSPPEGGRKPRKTPLRGQTEEILRAGRRESKAGAAA